ncbi:hypothetical protein X943_001966 [Babesia divergens]|uniref:Uncharacterized protein n=1 Tax=Babesia divergens TaxID=32595 RepID=A0AAD9GJP3_BABDI|nr:hypothetical protein X943_001966 [Babesia divergens]
MCGSWSASKLVADYSKNVITLVEVGITCQDNLGQVERDKEAKYKALTEQMGNHKMNALTTIEVVPYVMAWDGLVTKRHTECRLKLGVSDRMEETEDVVEGGRHKRRSRGLSSGTGPPLVEPSARRPAPAVLCET